MWNEKFIFQMNGENWIKYSNRRKKRRRRRQPSITYQLVSIVSVIGCRYIVYIMELKSTWLSFEIIQSIYNVCPLKNLYMRLCLFMSTSPYLKWPCNGLLSSGVYTRKNHIKNELVYMNMLLVWSSVYFLLAGNETQNTFTIKS